MRTIPWIGISNGKRSTGLPPLASLGEFLVFPIMLSLAIALPGVALGQANSLAPEPGPVGMESRKPGEPGSTAVGMARYKVVFWFDGASWQSRAYDVAHGEYTRAVDDWVKRTESDSFGFVRPGRMATIREISVPGLPAESRNQRLAAAIREELDRILRGRGDPTERPRPGRTNWGPESWPARSIERVTPRLRVPRRSMPAPGSSGIRPGISPNPSPFPYPYPRPHP
jgi:hypothetical protein